jgi:CheY-like chemotaxis protein
LVIVFVFAGNPPAACTYLTNYHATAVPNPPESLDRFNPNDLNCLLTDFSMPGMNGLELANVIRTIRPYLPVVIMTRFLHAHDLAPLRESEFHYLINKPFSLETPATKRHKFPALMQHCPCANTTKTKSS